MQKKSILNKIDHCQVKKGKTKIERNSLERARTKRNEKAKSIKLKIVQRKKERDEMEKHTLKERKKEKSIKK